MPNPSPKFKLKQLYDKPVAEYPVAVKLPVDLDAFVRSLPNRAEWLREAVAEKYEREQKQSS